MKKILFLTPTLPFPPVSGGVIKSFKVVQFLSEQYAVTVACLLKNDDALHVKEFLQTVKLNNFISEACDIPRTAKNLLLSNLQGIPLNLYRNQSAAFREKVHAVLQEHDVIFCDHYVMFQYIPKDYRGKIILHEHNCEYLIWKRYAAIEPNLLKKLALLNQAYRIRKYEQQICASANVVLAAPNDTEELVKIGAERSKFQETYHLGDDSLLNLPDLSFQETEKALLYIGTLSWEANIDGLVWFYNAVWPIVKQRHPEIKWYIVGKKPDPRIQHFADRDSSIVLTGFVEDVEPYFQKSRVFITPLRFGSGIKVKVVNALYRGIPCVTTSIGTEGLNVQDGTQIYIRNSPDEQVAAIDILLENQVMWNTISGEARATARKYYTWDRVLEIIRLSIES